MKVKLYVELRIELKDIEIEADSLEEAFQTASTECRTYGTVTERYVELMED